MLSPLGASTSANAESMMRRETVSNTGHGVAIRTGCTEIARSATTAFAVAGQIPGGAWPGTGQNPGLRRRHRRPVRTPISRCCVASPVYPGRGGAGAVGTLIDADTILAAL